MQEKSFNLVTDPWLKVFDNESHTEKTVSLVELFNYSQQYESLAGDMKAQDLAILRFLLAILTTVYSRFNAQDEPYDWLELDDNYQLSEEVDEDEDQDEIADDLLNTWKDLYQEKTFSKIVIEYLEKYKSRFDLFGDTPFYQVTQSVYDENVEAKKRVAKGKGTVSVKQINRVISESNNSPSLFSPKSDEYKNRVNYAELARWLITYQNFTGVTDKTKYLSKEKFSVSSGWLYGLNPVFIKGKNLFETLMLNLVLVPQNSEDFEYKNQKPVWEYDDTSEFLKNRVKGIFPDNLAELYTDWSRMLHIEWQEDQPTIFSAGLPKFEYEDMPANYIEPMTTWRANKDGIRPATKSKNNLSVAMWRNFGNYISVSEDNDYQPGIVDWLQFLKVNEAISKTMQVNLCSIALISDGNATSQSPYAEVVDNMKINAEVLFDSNSDEAQRWPAIIEGVIETTQQVGTYYYWFIKEISELRSIKDNSYANKLTEQFYDALNRPFYNWLAGLTNQDESGEKISQWQDVLNQIAFRQAQDTFRSATSLEIRGKDSSNIFTIYNKFRRNVAIKLDGKGAKKK
ncbi:type I-E CRISPR-associated protein Cse1/CasA [Lactobacillus hamsteri]|uniref:CRISPR-associated protein, cse1 n=1 Tax=Lactobacillus hamsteri DSM 5661 = JCM 6256 TaxID=1423754 RepID=A0A0R1Y7Q4_9LACO|nr:type I-E CRISPR-associated protein Cse1/CasA [Lactobacillus hamsteri]KRM38173.1 CRISPR-associated protein, cse1 [Lactobacillus hamsteri DSM 5661 = JCM 6256]